MNTYRNYDLQRHKKSDKIKWIVTSIALLLISLTIVGVCLQVFGNGKQKPSEWFKKDAPACVHIDENADGKCDKCKNAMSADNENKDGDEITVTAGSKSAMLLKSAPWRAAASDLTASEIQAITGFSVAYVYPASNKASFFTNVAIKNNIDGNVFTSSDHFTVFRSNPSLMMPSTCNFLLVPKINIFEHLSGYTLQSVEFVWTDQNRSPVDIPNSDYYLFLIAYGIELGTPNCTLTYNLVDNRVVVPLPSDPVKEGHKFVGWYYDEAFTKPYDNKPIYEDTRLYAKFEINRYTVAFDANGGSSVDAQTVDWNTSVELPATSRDKHAFLGWYLPNGTQYTDQSIKENTTLTARWERNVFTVTFDTNGGSTVENIEVNLNSTVPLPTIKRTGYTLKGWFMSDGTQYTNQPVTSDISLIAQWEVIMCTVTFYVDGEVYDTKQVEYGTYILRVVETAATMNLQVVSLSSPNGEFLSDTFNELTVASDLNVNSIEMDGIDKVKGTFRNNWIVIVAATVAGIWLIGMIVLIVDKAQKPRRR